MLLLKVFRVSKDFKDFKDFNSFKNLIDANSQTVIE